MYVEDLFIKIRDTLYNFLNLSEPFDAKLSDQWHTEFIASVASSIDQNRSISTKQTAIVLKIIAKVRSHIIDLGWASEQDIDRMLSDPQYRIQPYVSANVPREVRHLGDNLLAFRFKKDNNLRDRIKNLCYAKATTWRLDYEMAAPNNKILRPRYNWLYRVWIIPVYRFNVHATISLIKLENFGLDEETARYLKLARASFDKPSTFGISNEIIVANVCDDPMLAGWITEVANGIVL